MKKIYILMIIIFINTLYSEEVKFYNPSFDCNNVKKDTLEYIICINEDLSKLDRELNENYKRIINDSKLEEELKINIQNIQKYWLKDIRNGCINSSCLKYVYTNKNIELKSIIYRYDNEFLDIQRKIENNDYKKCLIKASNGFLEWECNKVVIESYEKIINLLDIEILNYIKNTKNGFFDELPKYYRMEDIEKVKFNLIEIYNDNMEQWYKYSLTYYDYLNNTYSIQDGTMWQGVADRNKIEFLKNRIKMQLNIKNKIIKGN